LRNAVNRVKSESNAATIASTTIAVTSAVAMMFVLSLLTNVTRDCGTPAL
jgi:hypothetical protein